MIGLWNRMGSGSEIPLSHEGKEYKIDRDDSQGDWITARLT